MFAPYVIMFCYRTGKDSMDAFLMERRAKEGPSQPRITQFFSLLTKKLYVNCKAALPQKQRLRYCLPCPWGPH